MRRVALFLLIAAVAGGLLAGCSGAGAPADENAGVRALAQDNVDAAVTIANWMRSAYVEYLRQVSANTSFPEPNRRAVDTIYVDGTTEHYEVDETTRSSVTTTMFPDGSSAVHESTPLSLPGIENAAHYSTIYSTGARVELDAISISTRPTIYEHRGTTTTQAGSSTDFYFHRTVSARKHADVVEVTLPNDTKLRMNVPLKPRYWASDGPVYEKVTTGEFTTLRGNTLNFTLRGSTAEAWDQLRVTASDGTTGSFTLGEGMSGSGELRKDGQSIAALTWDKNGNGEVAIIDATYDLAPSAAARDFQIANWAYRVSILGPVPGF
ncbi:MAG: hypothetical protein ACM3VW_02335 [Bacteroidota bacterium]